MEQYAYLQLSCQILIIGAGPAGLAAAISAAEAEQTVIILDDNPRAGGQVWRQGVIDSLPSNAKRYLAQLAGLQQVTLLSSSKVFAVREEQKTVLFENLTDCGIISYQKLILCLGARERFLPFPGWTLPGVTGVGGLQALVKNGLPIVDEQVVVAGSGPLLLATAQTVKQQGGKIIAVIEQAPWKSLISLALQLYRWPTKLAQAIQLAPWRHYYANSVVLEAIGQEKLSAVRVQIGKQERWLTCTRLACGFGLNPNVELAQLFGCHIINGKIFVDHLQQTSIDSIYAAGECTGIGGSELALAEGHIAGLAATGQHAKSDKLAKQRRYWCDFSHKIAQTFLLNERVRDLATTETIVCRCEDVILGELSLFSDWTQAKITTRCGMGACQGKICAAITQEIFNWPAPVPRIPLSPVNTLTFTKLLSLPTIKGPAEHADG